MLAFRKCLHFSNHQPIMLRLMIPAIASRGFHTSQVNHLKKVRSGRYKGSKNRSVALTYEMAKPPQEIGVTKAWNSWNTSNLFEEGRESETLIEDMFIRQFMAGTWHGMFVSELIIKRRYNMIYIGGLLQTRMKISSVYFLVGYTEELLSYLLKCPVKVDFQTVKDSRDMNFKFI